MSDTIWIQKTDLHSAQARGNVIVHAFIEDPTHDPTDTTFVEYVRADSHKAPQAEVIIYGMILVNGKAYTIQEIEQVFAKLEAT